MDLTTIWAFLGGTNADTERRARIEAARVAPDTVVMVPLTEDEKAERLETRKAEEARSGRRRRIPRTGG